VVDSMGGTCRRHHERRASITCKYCGDYACSDCTVDTMWGQTLCTACEARGLARYPVPWDRVTSPWAFFATCRAVLRDLRLMFPNLPDGSVARAVGFSWAVAMLYALAIALFEILGGPSLDFVQTLSLVIVGVAYATSVVAAGVSFHFAQKLLGGGVDVAASIRASGYLSATGVLPILGLVAPGVVFVMLLVASMTLWISGWVLFGRGRAGLGRNGALAAAGVALVGGTLGGVVGLVIAALPLILADSDLG